MRLKIYLSHILLCLLLVACSLPFFDVQGAQSPWISVGPGIDYQHFSLPGPVETYVARMDRHNQGVTLESVVANGKLASGGETVSSMASRIDQSISQWSPTSGNRNRVVVAINGSGYTANAEPKSGMIVSGFYAKRFDDLGGGSGFGWRLDRSAFIGKCVSHEPDQQFVSFPDSSTGETLKIDGVNVGRGPNQLIIYTPQYGENTRTSTGELEVVIELGQPLLPQSNPGVLGNVREIRDGAGSTPIPFDTVVLSASGSARQILLNNLAINARVEINQRIQHSDWDCNGENTFSWAGTYASMHGDYAVLREGEVYPKSEDAGATNRQPRTAIAYNQDFIFFIVVDGRSDYSVGMSFEELAVFSRDTLGATSAIAQDGGGSTDMVINGAVMNHPVSKCTISAQTYLPLVTQASSPVSTPQAVPTPAGSPTPVPDVFACERAVANSMMMVYLEPGVRSGSYYNFDQIITSQAADIRLGPGTNFGLLQSVPAGSTGIILPHLGNLSGILAKGAYWWKVDLNGVVGWISENNLSYINSPPVGLDLNMEFVDIEP